MKKGADEAPFSLVWCASAEYGRGEYSLKSHLMD